MSSEIGIQNAYVELSDGRSGLLLDLKVAVDLPTGVLELTNLTPEEDYIVKLFAVDTEFNTT